MKKYWSAVITALLILGLLTACNKPFSEGYKKYTEAFFDTFDTVVQVVGYAKSEEEFKHYAEQIHRRFQELHKYYDIYNNYDGINNIKTINDNAGIQPVKVEQEIIDLILFAKEWYKIGHGKANIAMGSVLKIWHDYREQGKNDPESAVLPPADKLLDAAKHRDIDKVIVDTANNTVYLADEKMSLDVGSVAKGFATELVAKEIMKAGFESGIISAGGNVRVLGKPLDGIRERWGIGIQNPDKYILTTEENLLDTVFVNQASVVSSGIYQRYYVVNGEIVHHLIDPETLRPGNYYKAVTVVAPDSGVADFLSTAVFLLPYEKSRALVESIENLEALWVMPDGEVRTTEGMDKILKSRGASGAEKE